MSEHLTVEVADADGAIREALDDIDKGTSRNGFLKKALTAGGTVVLGGVAIGGLPALVTAAPGPAQDTKILNFALLLEYLEAEFYTRASASGALSGEAREFSRVVGAHERAHVAFLKKALGSKAGAKPTFDFKGTTEDQTKFLATARVLEDTGVAAYNGQGPNLTKPTLAAAASIVSVEARHAAWVRDILQQNPAPAAFDAAKTQKQIETAVGATGFITA
ncbi:MAG: ferritin-like domain-containing protein [Actinomycetota bacterium]|nr:ferritin-like domain-containing protein [Actinomycetota bacterium]